MHHSRGAATETIYIYGDVIDETNARLTLGCKTCIVGLGLGYIEICWALSLIKLNIKPSMQMTFDSFEIVPELRQNFLHWIRSDESAIIYDEIVGKLNGAISSMQVKNVLREALQNGSSLYGDLKEFTDPKQKWNLICYDAFSRKTNEGLWSYEFLDSFFTNFTASDCVFTTYACTAILRKTLEKNGFELTNREGFSGKRESTLAHKKLSANQKI